MRSFGFTDWVACLGFGFIAAYCSSASSQDRTITTRCLSIPDVNARVDCLESRGASLRAEPSPALNVGTPNAMHIGPSFDCRGARTSIERAICADPILSEWDYRMGQQYQQAVQIRMSSDADQIVKSQRAWLSQRDTSCSVVADTAVWDCLLEMTKQRMTALSKMLSIEIQETPLVSPSASNQLTSNGQISAALNTPKSDPTNSPNLAPQAPESPASEEQANSWLIIIFSIIAIGVFVIFSRIRRKERLAAERQRLIAKYGLVDAERILAQKIWQGMTEEQLVESWGVPVGKNTEVLRSKIKETWKYGQTGKNRFDNRVYVENGIVVGWKQ